MTLIFLAIVLTFGSLIQLIWTARIVRRVNVAWAALETIPPLGRWESLSRAAPLFWGAAFTAVLISYLVVALDARHEPELISLGLATMVWCFVLFIVSLNARWVVTWRRAVSFSRELAATAPAETGPAWSSSNLSHPDAPTREEFARRLQRLQRLTNIALWFALIVLAAPCVIGLIALVIEHVDSGTGSLLAMLAAVAFPAWGVYAGVSVVAKHRARQAQLLWFLATTIKHQRPLAAELSLWADAHDGLYRERLRAAAREMADGLSLAEALDVVGGLVPASVMVSLRVAEQTHTLAETLRDSAERQTEGMKEGFVSNTAFGAGTYLWLLLAFGTAITGFLMVFIVPKYKAIFRGFGAELPWLSQWVFTTLDNEFTSPLLGLLSFGLLWLVALLSEAAWRGWPESRLAWRLGLGRRMDRPRLLRRLRMAVVSHLPLDTALRPMVLSHPWRDARVRLERVLGRVTAGENCWHALRDVGLLPARDVTLIEIAERAGNLEWALASLAEAHERRFTHRWRMVISTVVPLLTLLAGLAVGLVCVAFFLPLSKLINDMS